MTTPSSPGSRLHIDTLELDLRGIPPTTVEAAARLLGPAFAQAFAQHRARLTVAEPRLDAGRLVLPASPGANELAVGIARHVVGSLRGERT
ncbi:hypothetical protein [Pseudomonas akapageensis]|uniref:hypothetical protein n=1 Tax=Pseudomonas akapageensis TaxID=2609961 RepID=UPI00140B671C|nr:hypothetical protein [Pseudomonas akapageensis]